MRQRSRQESSHTSEHHTTRYFKEQFPGAPTTIASPRACRRKALQLRQLAASRTGPQGRLVPRLFASVENRSARIDRASEPPSIRPDETTDADRTRQGQGQDRHHEHAGSRAGSASPDPGLAGETAQRRLVLRQRRQLRVRDGGGCCSVQAVVDKCDRLSWQEGPSRTRSPPTGTVRASPGTRLHAPQVHDPGPGCPIYPYAFPPSATCRRIHCASQPASGGASPPAASSSEEAAMMARNSSTSSGWRFVRCRSIAGLDNRRFR